jgi:hypothetical protein
MHFKKLLSRVNTGGGRVDPELGNLLFRMMDSDKRGSVFYKELIYFYLRHENDISVMYNSWLNSASAYWATTSPTTTSTHRNSGSSTE